MRFTSFKCLFLSTSFLLLTTHAHADFSVDPIEPKTETIKISEPSVVDPAPEPIEYIENMEICGPMLFDEDWELYHEMEADDSYSMYDRDLFIASYRLDDTVESRDCGDEEAQKNKCCEKGGKLYYTVEVGGYLKWECKYPYITSTTKTRGIEKIDDGPYCTKKETTDEETIKKNVCAREDVKKVAKCSDDLFGNKGTVVNFRCEFTVNKVNEHKCEDKSSDEPTQTSSSTTSVQ